MLVAMTISQLSWYNFSYRNFLRLYGNGRFQPTVKFEQVMLTFIKIQCDAQIQKIFTEYWD